MKQRLLNVLTRIWIVLGIAIATLWVYLQVINHEFLLYDDYGYIVKNYYLQPGMTWENIVWAFTSGYAANWHPLTWLSHMLDFQLFGLEPAGHHLHNVLLHLLSAVLLFLVFCNMTGDQWPSAFVAMVFALHPLHVESVAWAAERKDTLSALLWVLTMGAYVRYTRKPVVLRYLLVLMLVVLGLLAKPMLVTLPFVLLLLDYWPLQRFRSAENTAGFSFLQLFVEKIPLLLLTLGSSLITFSVQERAGAVSSITGLPFEIRLGNAIASYVQYIVKTLWPTDLAVFYPHPGSELSWTMVTLSAVVVAGITALAFVQRKRSPSMVVGWCWYLGTLVPVIGLVQVGSQAMADRYMYIPMIGLTIVVAWLVVDAVAPRRIWRRIVAGSVVVLTLLLMSVSKQQVGYWKDGRALFTHAAEVTKNNWLAYYNLGLIEARGGAFDQAVEQYRRALQFNPGLTPAYYELGAALQRLGRHADAIRYFEESVRREPAFVKARIDLGVSLATIGRNDDALFHFAKAREVNPATATPHHLLGLILVGLEQDDVALAYLERAHALAPSDSLVHADLTRVRERLQQLPDSSRK